MHGLEMNFSKFGFEKFKLTPNCANITNQIKWTFKIKTHGQTQAYHDDRYINEPSIDIKLYCCFVIHVVCALLVLFSIKYLGDFPTVPGSRRFHIFLIERNETSDPSPWWKKLIFLVRVGILGP